MMSEAEAWTVGRLLQWTADYLKRHQSESPRLDAEVLLAHALGCQRIQLYTTFDETPPEPARTAFRALVRRRAEGEPVAYLVGKREFYSLSFRVTPDVLIPRPETEMLVLTLLDLVKQQYAGREVRICDVGTGSGIIAVCAAKYLPQARVTAVDISPAALEVARANAADHGVAGRIEFCPSDLLSAVPAEAQFDFVVSNPPYVAESEMETLARDVRTFEPRTALVAGPQGTEVIARLIPAALARLPADGYLLLEISPLIHDRVLALVRSESQLELAPTIKDLARRARVIQARKK
jgi:release factor glutamine methyltransferase